MNYCFHCGKPIIEGPTANMPWVHGVGANTYEGCKGMPSVATPVKE